MKKFISLTCLTLLVSIANAQISGTIAALADTTWTLEGNSISPIKVKGSKTGQFYIDIKSLKKGIYHLGEIKNLYLEPSYQLVINHTNQGYHFEGNGATENNAMLEIKPLLKRFLGNPGYDLWHQYLLTPPSEFIPMLDEYVHEANISAEKSNNAFFRDFVKNEAEFDKRYCLYAYNRFYGLDSTKMNDLRKLLSTPVQDRKENFREELTAAYQKQFSKKLTREEILNLNKKIYEGWNMDNEFLLANASYYENMIGSKIDYLTYSDDKKQLRDSLQNDHKVKIIILQSLITNPNIKEEFTYRYTKAAIKQAKTPPEVSDIYNAFLKTSTNKIHIAQIKSAYQNIAASMKNAIAPEFNYVNTVDKPVNLKDLRGKYVYIDIWATWCAPCIAEMPSLKKLANTFKDKKISFVSISVDKITQKKEWLNFVKKNNLEGIQLIADQDFNSEFIKKFGISSIPRFILIAPDGKIIDNNAKRPSDAKLVAQLNQFKM